MAVTAGDTIQITWLGRCFAQRIMLDLTYRVTVGNATLTTTQVLQELNSHIFVAGAGDMTTDYIALLPPSYSLEEIRSQVLRPVRQAFVPLGTAGTVGTNANPATVASDAASIVRRTNLAGRRHVSTLKIGPVPDGGSAAGLLTVAYRTLLATFGQKTLNPIVLPVSTVQLIPTILTALGDADGRDLTTFLIPTTSRVNRRRTVGVGE